MKRVVSCLPFACAFLPALFKGELALHPEDTRLVTKVSTTNRVNITGLSGGVSNNYLTDKIVLHFAQLYMPLANMYSTETTKLSRGAGVEVSGFIGFPALRQMTMQIDYRDDLIHFAFDPKRPVNPKFARIPNR